jgi:hypothetical protein
LWRRPAPRTAPHAAAEMEMPPPSENTRSPAGPLTALLHATAEWDADALQHAHEHTARDGCNAMPDGGLDDSLAAEGDREYGSIVGGHREH